MSSPEDRIRDLAKKSAIGEADAARLLAAVRSTRPEVGASRWNPFERWSGERTALMGVAIALVAVAMSRLHVRTDGALDIHRAHGASLGTALLDQVAAFPLAALSQWGIARALTTKVRFVDILGAVGLARLPAVVMMPIVALLAPAAPPSPPALSPLLLVVALITLVGLGFHIYWLVLGFRTATGFRGGKLTLAFLGALVAGEVASKIFIHFVSR
jgi:hypothetical protein